tara:strand:- start:145 stop:408 length:264 start_codon:yes stop_codon:yes gene_type:complete
VLIITLQRQKYRKVNTMDKMKKTIAAMTDLGIALLTFGIIASLLVGPANLSFVGNVVGNITDLVAALGSNGLVGLITLMIILNLVDR